MRAQTNVWFEVPEIDTVESEATGGARKENKNKNKKTIKLSSREWSFPRKTAMGDGETGLVIS